VRALVAGRNLATQSEGEDLIVTLLEIGRCEVIVWEESAP
jgi:hypothetical protein